MIHLRNLVLALSALLPLQCPPTLWPTLQNLARAHFEPGHGLRTHLLAHHGTKMLVLSWRSDTRLSSGLLIACQLGSRLAVVRCSESRCVILLSGVTPAPERSPAA